MGNMYGTYISPTSNCFEKCQIRGFIGPHSFRVRSDWLSFCFLSNAKKTGVIEWEAEKTLQTGKA